MKNHKLKLNGKEMTSAEFHRDGPVGAPGVPMVTTTYSDAKPLVSEALGCMKSQVHKYRETIRSEGIEGVCIRDNGQAAITSRRGRAKLLNMKKQHDNDGGYGDG